MDYKFYGSDTPSVSPIKKEFSKITDQRHLYELLNDLWCRQTCAPRMQEQWSKSNKTKGQCSITAFLFQDIFGGEVYGIELHDGSYHCFNKIDDVVFDLTSEQFGNIVLNYNNAVLQKRDDHFSKFEKFRRYLYLKTLLREKLQTL